MERKVVTCPESALAAEIFEKFCSAQTLKAILAHFRHLCQVLQIQPTNFPYFYPKLKSKLVSWKAQALWNKFDKRASHKCYNRGRVCLNTRVLVIGAGPCGLRAAIEAQLLGAKVVVIEKRDRISRNNVLHLWPYVIHDLKGLGAKKFFGKFCAGAIDHISIRQLQYILLKVALLFGIEIHEGVGFESLAPPPPSQENNERIGWRAIVSQPDHPISQYEFDVLIGADGKRNTLDGFRRKEFRGKLAIAITANFINRRSEAEARVEEISGVAFIFNQRFFKELYDTTGIDLENIVYYKDDTHYFVMTAKKHSLIDKGVILNDYGDTSKLLSLDNVDRNALMDYAREAADFSTKYQLPQLEFAVNHYGQPDIAMFDFTSMYAAENATRVLEVGGHRLLVTLVGDSLLEPFWPTGSGCARGFLSCMDACWAIRSWALGHSPLAVLAERESIYRLLAQTTPENLHRDIQGYTLDPHSRYPNLNTSAVLPIQVKSLYCTDDSAALEMLLAEPPSTPISILDNSLLPKKRRKRDSSVAPETLLRWLQKQVSPYEGIVIEDMTNSFKDGLALCAIIHRYRPHLIDFSSLDKSAHAVNNQLAFDILEREFTIPPVMTGEEMASCQVPDKLALTAYLSQVYDSLRGEIPHIKHPKIEDLDLGEEGKSPAAVTHHHRVKTLNRMSATQKVSLLGRLVAKHHHHKADHQQAPRKRRSDRENRSDAAKKSGSGKDEQFNDRVRDLEAKLRGALQDKKPKDLLRAIGKIEKSDWNVKEIEKKMEENRMGRGISKKTEKVPKWSKQLFDDKFSVMEKKLTGQTEAQVDSNRLETSTVLRELRGSQKVSNMAKHLAQTIMPSPVPEHAHTNGTSRSNPVQLNLPASGGSESCHFCHKRVYLMERLSAEGRFFHRGCFRCQYCQTTLRLGNYMYDREGRYGHKFFCIQHYGLECGISISKSGRGSGASRIPQRALRSSHREEVDNKEKAAVRESIAGQDNSGLETNSDMRANDAVMNVVQSDEAMTHTPERIEFENLVDESVEVEEDEWTDRNFGQTSTDNESSSNISDSEDSDSSSEEAAFAEDDGAGGRGGVGGAIDPAEETLRLAEDWTRRYHPASDTSYHDQSADSSNDSEEEESEAEELKAARELRRREVPASKPVGAVTTDSEEDDSHTEVASEECSESESESESEGENENNSATEISTDSEFEHDGTTPHLIPDIVINDSILPTVQVKKGELEQPKQVLLINKPINGKINQPKDIKLELRKIDDWKDNKKEEPIQLANRAVTSTTPKPFLNPNRGDYLLNRTQSTEGIASKISLELKKKYLLGGAGSAGAVKKSGSASTLDTKLKSLIDQISEKQKMLNVSGDVEPSPAMQAVLQGADRIKAVSPLKSKQLPSYQEFRHVCALKDKEKFSEEEDKKEENEGRARSPVHETSILVPDLPRPTSQHVADEEHLESDSLSSSTGSSGEEDEEDSIEAEAAAPEQKQQPPPKLEVHNSRGELMEESIAARVVTAPEGSVLKRVSTTRELEPSPPASPPTETEMSDWARDVSLEEDDDDLSTAAQLPNRNRLLTKLADAENFEDFEHVCGKKPHPDSLPLTNPLNLDNIEFMDTGGVSSSDEGVKNPMINSGYVQFINPSEDDELPTPLVEATNFAYLAPPEDDSKNAEFTDTTTTSDATTVRNPQGGESTTTSSSDGKPVQADREYEEYVHRLRGRISPFKNAKDSIGMLKRKKSSGSGKTSDESLQEDSNSASAIPILSEVKEEERLEDNVFNSTNSLLYPNASPTTSRKLEEISKERSMQKDLVHEMVLNKVGSGTRPRGRRSRPVSACSITSPPPPPPDSPTTPNFQTAPYNSSISNITVTSTPPRPPLMETPRTRCISVSKLPLANSTPLVPQRSLPDIHSASSSGIETVAMGDFKTPVTASVLRCDLRQSAKAKYKMMSDEELGLSPEDKLRRIKERFNKYLSSSQEKLTITPKQPEESKKNGKDSERKRSIIQAVSDFFHKKSPSPPKTPSSHSPTKLIKFRSNKSKESLDEGTSGEPPPIPPLPQSYTPHDLYWSDEEGGTAKRKGSGVLTPSGSFPATNGTGFSGVTSASTPNGTQPSPLGTIDSASGKPRATSMASAKAARQAQNKRLRMAQELQRELEEVEVKQRELEARGVEVEKSLRAAPLSSNQQSSGDEGGLMGEWFELMRERCRLRAKEKELIIQAQELELEDRHARLQAQFKDLIASSNNKSDEGVALEGRILREMLEIVEKKEKLAKQLVVERHRREEEDREIEAQMLAAASNSQQTETTSSTNPPQQSDA